MSGPIGHIGNKQTVALPDLAQSKGWDDLKRLMEPAVMHNAFKPGDDVLNELARMAETELGQKVLNWLLSITDEAPYPQVLQSFEGVALAAAKHQGRAMVGAMLRQAVAEGKMLRQHMKG